MVTKLRLSRDTTLSSTRYAVLLSVRRVDNAETSHYTGHDRHDIHILRKREIIRETKKTRNKTYTEYNKSKERKEKETRKLSSPPAAGGGGHVADTCMCVSVLVERAKETTPVRAYVHINRVMTAVAVPHSVLNSCTYRDHIVCCISLQSKIEESRIGTDTGCVGCRRVLYRKTEKNTV